MHFLFILTLWLLYFKPWLQDHILVSTFAQCSLVLTNFLKIDFNSPGRRKSDNTCHCNVLF